MEKTMEMPKIISDTPVLHKIECTDSVVISRIQIIEFMGKKFKNNFWSNWNTGSLHHVEQIELN